MPHIDPTGAQLRALAEAALDGPIVMLNLLRFAADGGAERYARYIEAATPHLERAGGKLRFLGDARATVIGDEDWDEVLLVEYPSCEAFLTMIRDPDYPSGLRSAALADSRLICTTARRG
ncbi:MAG: DUF1330 domain-containing protein [Gammaproteobacteria bacterium]